MVKVAINGLGRIGRCVLRAYAEYDFNDIEIVAVNGPAPIETHLHLIKYDSVQGTFNKIKQSGDSELSVGKGSMKVFHERDPEKLPWGELGVDVVLECTGKFKTNEDLQKHIKAGAKKVLVSAPCEGAEAMVIFGVNNEVINKDINIASVGSCTTNCLAPVVKVLNDAIGIEQAFMTTIHAYTNDQNILDNSHKDLRRARGAALSMIPTSTGAAKAIGKVIPELNGKIDGIAVRVPTPNVSLVDLNFTATKNTSIEQINDAIKKAAESDLKGVLAYSDEPLVSIDYLHNSNSSIFDLTGTKVINDNFCRIASWYDNEWGFSVRMLDVTRLFASI